MKKIIKPKKYNKNLFFYAASFIIFFWGLVVHPFEFPDEQSHMGSVEFLSREGRMPVGEEVDMTEEMKLTQDYLGIFRNSQGQNKYTYHPEYHVEYTDINVGKFESNILALNSQDFRDTYVATEAARYPVLYYAYERAISKPFVDSDILTRLFVLRLGGVLLAFFMAYYVYRTGFLIFGKAVYARTLTLMVMLMPMFSFVSAGVNSDNLHNLLFTVVIYSGLRMILLGLTASTAITAFTAVTLDLYTKPQGAIALPVLGLALLITVIKNKNWKILFGSLLILLTVMLLGWSKLSPYFSLLTSVNPHGSSFVEFLRFSVNKLAAQNIVWFWGVFKWLGVVLPPIYWRLANRLVLLSVLGFIVYLYKILKKKKIVAQPLAISFLLLSTLLYTISIYWFDWTYTKNVGFSLGVQARYFYPVLVPMFALMLTGLLSFVSKVKYRRMIRIAIVIFFVFLQIGGLYTVLRSYYDVSSLGTLISQLSQYKPFWAKGSWWYIWGMMYLLALSYLAFRTIFARKSDKK